ncbi:katanin p80 WD40 repeat-containing subunit B1-like [Littorina saxatilis]|uniref:Anaphase-promoting complex subunit 4 WD40 domain-containing protein n=1 Tax=Littorina saxatilis TaxID=31220 RepID=A0AAN9BU58_9CAEN
MARRMLEESLRAAKGITLGEPLKEFTAVEVLKDVKLDPHYGGIFSLQYNFDGSHLVAGFSGGGIRMYKGRTGELVRELRPNRHGGFAIMCLRFHPKDPTMLYAGSAEGHVYLIHTETGALTHIVTEPSNQINAMDFCVDGYYFCTSGKDLAVRSYSTKTGKLDKTYGGIGSSAGGGGSDTELEAGNTMRVYALKFHPDNENIFITAGWDNHIKIWDLRTNDGIKRQIHGPHVCGDALDIKGQNILSGSWCANRALQEWDYGEGKLVRDIKFPHTNGAFLYCAEYGDLGTVLAGGSGTNSVEVIEAETNKVIGSVPMTKPVQAMDSALGGRLFATGGGDNLLRLSAMI